MLNWNELKDGKTNTAFSETHPSLIANLERPPEFGWLHQGFEEHVARARFKEWYK